MRIWMCEGEGGPLLTDEQLLALIASAGSLSAALRGGDVELIRDDRAPVWSPSGGGAKRGRLEDYLREDAK